MSGRGVTHVSSGARRPPGRGYGPAAGEKKGGKSSRLMEPRLSLISLGVPHAILGRKTQQKVEIQKFIFLRYGKCIVHECETIVKAWLAAAGALASRCHGLAVSALNNHDKQMTHRPT